MPAALDQRDPATALPQGERRERAAEARPNDRHVGVDPLNGQQGHRRFFDRPLNDTCSGRTRCDRFMRVEAIAPVRKTACTAWQTARDPTRSTKTRAAPVRVGERQDRAALDARQIGRDEITRSPPGRPSLRCRTWSESARPPTRRRKTPHRSIAAASHPARPMERMADK